MGLATDGLRGTFVADMMPMQERMSASGLWENP